MKPFALVCALVWLSVFLLFSHEVVSLPYSPRGSPRKVYRGHGPMHQDNPHTYPYDKSSSAEAFTEQRDQLRETRSIVHAFTSSTKRKLLVSAVSAATLVALVYFLSSLLFSAAPAMLLWFSIAGGAVGTFMKGDFGDFCRALGVFALLLVQRTSFTRFLVKFVSQSKAALQLAGRRPFPPGHNPWRYSAMADSNNSPALQFSMVSALMSISFAAAYVGYLIARVVPLLPNWIGALGGALSVGYATTLPNGRGDLLRYLGHCLTHCLTVVTGTVEDVELRPKLGALLGHVLFFSQTLDNKYHLLARLQLLLAELISRITIIISRMRRDMSGESTEQNYEYEDRVNIGNREGDRRRYGSRSFADGPTQSQDYQAPPPSASEESAHNDFDYDDQRDYRHARPRDGPKKKSTWW